MARKKPPSSTARTPSRPRGGARSLGPSARPHRQRAAARRPPGRRRPLGPRVQHRRGAARPGPRGPGAGDPRPLRDPVHFFRSPGDGPVLHKGLTKIVVRMRAFPRPISPWWKTRRRRRGSTCPCRCSPSRWPKVPARGSPPPRRSATAPALRRNLRELLGVFASRCWWRLSCRAGRSPWAYGHRRRRPRARQHGGPPAARGRGRGLFLRQQGALRGTRNTRPDRQKRRGGPPRPKRSPWPRGGPWAAATPAGWIPLRWPRVPHFMEVNPLAGIHPEHSDLPMLCSSGRHFLRAS